MAQRSIPIIELKGSPYERGWQHGEACKEAIHALIYDHYNSLAHFARARAKIDFDMGQSQKISDRYLPFMQAYAPDLIEELKGIADATGLPFHEILFLNCYLDVYDIVFPGLSQPLLYGCTTFAATQPATLNDATIVAQNLDLRAFFNQYGVLLRIFPDHGPSSLVYSMVGVVGLVGINQFGISMVFNKLVPKDSSYGVPYPFLARKVLQQSRIGQAIYQIANPHRASGSYSLLGSTDAGIYGIEATSSDYRVFPGDEGYLAHSNHYTHLSLDDHNQYYQPYAGDTYVRLNQASRILKKNFGRVSVETIKEIASNHANFPDAICRHSDQDTQLFYRAETMASLVFLPDERCCLISMGPPCENGYLSYSV